MMRSGLLLLMVAAMIAAGCRTVSYQTADSAAVEPAVFSCAEKALAEALAAFLYGRLIEEEKGHGTPMSLPYYLVAASMAPGSHTVHSRIAVEAFRRADLDAATAAMEASHAARPDDPVRQIDLAAMYQLTNRPDEAAILFRESLAGNPTNVAVYVALGDIYFARGEDAEALALFTAAFPQVAETEPLTTFLYQQARRFIARGDLDRAIGCFELLAEWQEENRAELGYVIGELFLAQQRAREALRILYEAIKLPRAPAAAFLRLGALLLEQESAAEAIRVIRTGGERFPELASFPFALGGLYAEDGQYEEALLAYEDAVRITRQSPRATSTQDAHANKNMLIAMAAAQERLKRYEDAAQTLEQVLEQFPHSHVAMNFLAYMWAELDTNLEAAYALSKRSLTFEPDNGAYLDTLGWIYYRKGELDTALDYLAKAREQLGDDPEIILHFGDVYAAKDDQEQALRFWKKSLRGDPTRGNRAWQQLEHAGINPEVWLAALEESETQAPGAPDADESDATTITETAEPAAQETTEEGSGRQADHPLPEKGLDKKGASY